MLADYKAGSLLNPQFDAVVIHPRLNYAVPYYHLPEQSLQMSNEALETPLNPFCPTTLAIFGRIDSTEGEKLDYKGRMSSEPSRWTPKGIRLMIYSAASGTGQSPLARKTASRPRILGGEAAVIVEVEKQHPSLGDGLRIWVDWVRSGSLVFGGNIVLLERRMAEVWPESHCWWCHGQRREYRDPVDRKPMCCKALQE